MLYFSFVIESVCACCDGDHRSQAGRRGWRCLLHRGRGRRPRRLAAAPRLRRRAGCVHTGGVSCRRRRGTAPVHARWQPRQRPARSATACRGLVHATDSTPARRAVTTRVSRRRWPVQPLFFRVSVCSIIASSLYCRWPIPLYRCSRSTFKKQSVGHARRKGA